MTETAPYAGPTINSPEHREWLAAQADGLLTFAENCIVPGRGAGWLDNTGAVDLTRPVHTWITCRMAHSFAIGSMLGHAGAREIAANAIAALRGPLHDDKNGGWYASIPAIPQRDEAGNELTDEQGHPLGADTTKAAYAHAFVVLAATSGVRAGIEGAAQLLDDALAVLDEKFFDAEYGLHVDEWNVDFTVLDPYRGVNANMHGVEALLAAGDVTADPRWHERALKIAQTVALTWAPGQSYRIPEHFNEQWMPQFELNADRPDDQFKPYGATVGHGIEWARLLLHLNATFGEGVHPWLVEGARQLYSRAVTDGWKQSSQGKKGLVYTTDWAGKPVVETRMHWVAAEALGAASALYQATGATIYAKDYERWLKHIQKYFLDPELGSWHHELTAANEPDDKVWPGKPDIYHAYQAMLIPLSPLSPSLASSVATGAGGRANRR